MSDEFFIGWQGKAPEKTGRFLKRVVIAGLVVALGLAAAVPALQKTVGYSKSQASTVSPPRPRWPMRRPPFPSAIEPPQSHDIEVWDPATKQCSPAKMSCARKNEPDCALAPETQTPASL